MIKRRGFTIVELMVVIVVIAILTSLVVVAYNNVQARTRDTIRKNDINSLAKQIQIYALQKQSWTGAGCGNGGMDGYTNLAYGANPTITSCLKVFDDTNKQLNDPSGCVSLTDSGAGCKQSIRGAYAAYNTIAGNGHYFLVAKLETVTDQLAITNNTDLDVTTKTNITTAGFNYILKVR